MLREVLRSRIGALGVLGVIVVVGALLAGTQGGGGSGLLGTTVASSPLRAGRVVSFTSQVYPDRYLCNQDGLGWIHPNDGTDQFKGDATFLVRTGLANSSALSFEPLGNRGSYLRNGSNRIRIDAPDTTATFGGSATWWARPGPAAANTVRFESLNNPGYFIRVKNFELWLVKSDGTDLFTQETTFNVVDGLKVDLALSPGNIDSSQPYTLTIGPKPMDGMITSQRYGLQCGTLLVGDASMCSRTMGSGTAIVLTSDNVQPKPRYNFTGFSGACTGVDRCEFWLSGNRTVTLNFELKPEYAGTP